MRNNGPSTTHTRHTPSFNPSDWIVDSRATHHITNDIDNLHLTQSYHGSDHLLVGNGSTLPITHTSKTALKTHTHNLSLPKVLHVPIVSQNLLSFSSLCKTNPISVEFFSNHFLVKDLKTRVPILKRLHRDGLYHMPYLPKSPTTYIMTSPSHKAQHNIYWHSSDRILRHLASHHQIRSSTTTPCISCSSSKSHKLPFTISSVVTTKLLELVYVDAWGLLLRGL